MVTDTVLQIAERFKLGGTEHERAALVPLIFAVCDSLIAGAPVDEDGEARLITGSSDPARARSYLARSAERDAAGRIVGLMGLSLAGHPHRFSVDGRVLSTWCAWDSLYLPAILGITALVESASPLTGERLEFRVGPTGVMAASPAAVLTVPQDECDAGGGRDSKYESF